jgi:hypothetical protein
LETIKGNMHSSAEHVSVGRVIVTMPIGAWSKNIGQKKHRKTHAFSAKKQKTLALQKIAMFLSCAEQHLKPWAKCTLAGMQLRMYSTTWNFKGV